MYFEPNLGQTDHDVRFLSRGGGLVTLLSGNSTTFINPRTGKAARLGFPRARAPRSIEPEGLLPGISNYFYGKDPAKWRTRVPHYSRVRFREVYPGIDVIFYSREGRFEYDFEIAPGADPSLIELAWLDGIPVRLEGSSGDLVAETAAGPIRLKTPEVYQEIDGRRVAIAARYRTSDEGHYQIALANWDRSRRLVIDPILFYSTFLGGDQDDETLAITVDPGGPAYVAGYTSSLNYPLFHPLQNTIERTPDVVVTKINVTGTTLVYSTFLGAEGDERAYGIAADRAGNAYVTGFSTSFGFPTTEHSFQPIYSGRQDAFLFKLSPEGDKLVYSTYVGTDDTFEIGYVVGVDAGGHAILAGTTNSPSFPTTEGAIDRVYHGSDDMFIMKFDPLGGAALFSTYFGGTGSDKPDALALDIGGNIYIAGETTSPNFPTTPGAIDTTPNGQSDAFLLKISQNGRKLVFSTVLGGGGNDAAFGLAFEPGGRIVLAGQAGPDFPTTANAMKTTVGGLADAFVARINSEGTSLIASTLVGTTGHDLALGVRGGRGGYPIIVGFTNSNSFPTTVDAFGFSSNNNGDGFLSIVEPLGNGLKFSSILGGLSFDVPRGLAMDSLGDLYTTGQTFSPDFPTTGDAFDRTHNGFGDSFLTRISNVGLTECTTPITATGQFLLQGGGAGSITTGAGTCPWYAFVSAPWLTLTTSPLGAGAGTTGFGATANLAPGPRTALVHVGGNLVHVLQRGTTLQQPFNDVALDDPFIDYIGILKSNAITDGCAAGLYCPGDNVTRGQMAVFIIRSLVGSDDFEFREAPYFTDVAATHPQFKWIQKMRELGITTGCNLIEYCPDAEVTREQMAVFLIRSRFGDSFPVPPNPYFTDAGFDNLFYNYIQKLRQVGITTGCSATQFCPGAPTTRGQMAVFLVRIFFTPW